METGLLSSSSNVPSENAPILASSSSPSETVVAIPDDHSKKYDVFLNFRGEDTRKNILGHLRAALSDKGIKTFVDDNQIERGRYISPQLVQAIEDSSCAVVIISPNYASSSWCLDELVKILDCMRTRGQIVIPVFYHVDPSHVRKQVGSFGEAFAKHEKDLLEESLERVNRWRVALTEVTSLAGLDLQNYRDEAHFIKEIVSEVSWKLNSLASLEVLEEDQPHGGALYSCAKVAAAVVSSIGGFLLAYLVLPPLFLLFILKVVEPILDYVWRISQQLGRSTSNVWGINQQLGRSASSIEIWR